MGMAIIQDAKDTCEDDDGVYVGWLWLEGDGGVEDSYVMLLYKMLSA